MTQIDDKSLGHILATLLCMDFYHVDYDTLWHENAIVLRPRTPPKKKWKVDIIEDDPD